MTTLPDPMPSARRLGTSSQTFALSGEMPEACIGTCGVNLCARFSAVTPAMVLMEPIQDRIFLGLTDIFVLFAECTTSEISTSLAFSKLKLTETLRTD